MKRPGRTFGLVVGAATALVVAHTPTASAAVTVGQAPPSGGVPLVCGPFTEGVGIDMVQVGSVTGNPYVVPAGGGVITSWQSMSSDNLLAQRLRLFSGNAAAVQPLAESRLESVGPGGPHTFYIRLTARGGELLGSSVAGQGTFNCANEQTAAEDVIAVAETQALGQTETVIASTTNSLLNLSAVLEPDADGDGLGDETQDALITKKPKKRTTKVKAKFAFAGAAAFECKVDRKAFKPCGPSLTVKKLKPGKHKLTVHALVPTGEVSPDAKHRWRVLRED